MKELSDFREEYNQGELHENQMLANPLEQFTQWMNTAIENNLSEPNAMAIATVNREGKPSLRIVLLKEVNREGFVFFTNYSSRKGHEISENPFVAVVFDWHEIGKQVRIEGHVELLSNKESDIYFDSRPESSKIGAWVSPQSEIIADRETLDLLQKETEERFANQKIYRPPHWGGYLIKPTVIEFWQGRPSRLHDRIVYRKNNNDWEIARLAP